MNSLTRLLEHITAAGFVAVAVVAVRAWRRGHDPGAGSLAAALGLLAVVAAVGSLGDAFSLRYTLLVDVGLVALMASGYALLRFRASFLPLSSAAHALAAGALALTTVLVVAADLNPQPNATLTAAQTAAITAAVLVWCVCVAEPVRRFWTASRHRPAVQRARLRALCAGYSGLILILLLAILPASISGRDDVKVGLQVGALLVVPLLWASFAPPGWLKRSWREKEEEAMRRAVEELLTRADDDRVLGERAVDWAIRLVGADAGALVDADGQLLVNRGVDEGVAASLLPVAASGARIATLAGPPRSAAVVVPVPISRGTGALITVSGPFTPVYGEEEVLRLAQFAVSTGTALERNRLAEAVRRSEEQFRLLVQGVRDYALYTLTPDGTVLTWNAGGERLKGYTPDEIVGRSFAVFYTAEDIAAGLPARALEAAATAGRYETDGWRVRKDGSRFYANVVITALREDGELTGFAKMTRDITDKRQVEEALMAARDTAEIASRVKSDFLSRMSHELRTPLNAVIGFAELLLMDENLSADQQDMLDTIRKAGAHQLDLINDVLDISRVESGHLSPSSEPVAVDELISEAMHLLHPQAAARGITMRRTESTRSLYAVADRQRLKQVLINLVSNAVKYNREAGTVEISADANVERVRVSVRDTGAGLTATEMQRLFRPFERLGHTEIEGTGLGLALSRHLVEAMNGKLDVESTPGEGSRFHVDLVAADPDDISRTHHEVLSAIPVRRGKREQLVLYIEDNLSNFDLVQKILGRRPHIRVISAPQGSIGLQAARDHHPDLVLLDLHLPDLPGSEVLRRLRTDPATRDVPVVVISADATKEQVAAMLAGGAADYLTKPLDIRRFLGVLEATMEEPKQSARR